MLCFRHFYSLKWVNISSVIIPVRSLDVVVQHVTDLYVHGCCIPSDFGIGKINFMNHASELFTSDKFVESLSIMLVENSILLYTDVGELHLYEIFENWAF